MLVQIRCLWVIALILFHHYSFSQIDNLPRGENGLISFEEVIELKHLKKETLFDNAQRFLSGIKEVNQKKKINNLVVADSILKASTKGSFLVYNIKSPTGEIKYQVRVQVKDFKYRYQFTNFVFYPYNRDRYGKFKINKWKCKPLEDPLYPGDQQKWNKHKTSTNERVNELIADLAISMLEWPHTKKKKTKKKKVEW